MMPRFADAYFYLGLVNPRDQAHERVRTFASQAIGPVVTTSWVLAEVGNSLAAPSLRSIFIDLMRELRSDPEAEIVPSTDGLFDQGIELFSRRPDKSWSLTDCISFVVMNERGLTEALTGDHHFEQAGFRALLKSP